MALEMAEFMPLCPSCERSVRVGVADLSKMRDEVSDEAVINGRRVSFVRCRLCGFVLAGPRSAVSSWRVRQLLALQDLSGDLSVLVNGDPEVARWGLACLVSDEVDVHRFGQARVGRHVVGDFGDEFDVCGSADSQRGDVAGVVDGLDVEHESFAGRVVEESTEDGQRPDIGQGHRRPVNDEVERCGVVVSHDSSSVGSGLSRATAAGVSVDALEPTEEAFEGEAASWSLVGVRDGVA